MDNKMSLKEWIVGLLKIPLYLVGFILGKYILGTFIIFFLIGMALWTFWKELPNLVKSIFKFVCAACKWISSYKEKDCGNN